MTQTKTKAIKIALVGNPNVGKSVIFHYLTGVYAEVSNYPGTTIEITKALIPDLSEGKDIEIIDTPGVYGISSFNDEEAATRDFVLDADFVINVVSASTLKRDLFLTQQLAELGKPTLLLINQIDEAKLNKVEIDIKKLEEDLGLKVLTSVAIKQETLKPLKESILEQIQEKEANFQVSEIDPELEKDISAFSEKVLSRAEALMIAEGDEVIANRNGIELGDGVEALRQRIFTRRRKNVDKIYASIISKADFSKRAILGHLLLHPIIGSLVALAVLYVFLYQFLGIFVAGTVVDLLENSFFGKYYEPAVRYIIELFLVIKPDDLSNLLFTDIKAALGTFLAGDYGVLTLTITYLYGLLAPLVFGFYFGLAILEDCGYLPRLAVLTDGILSRLGMNGRAIIPLILGGGCVTMAVVTTRLLTSKKEKIITMALLGLSIPCSAQLGVIQGLLSNLGGVRPWAIWAFVLFVVFVLAGTIMNKLIPGDSGCFVSDIPPMRLPRFENIFKKTISRSKVFLDEATPAFFIAAALVGFLQITECLIMLLVSLSQS